MPSIPEILAVTVIYAMACTGIAGYALGRLSGRR
jgi:VIT1/CCC1 family predicted Fe2+/Mn2+ transporter